MGRTVPIRPVAHLTMRDALWTAIRTLGAGGRPFALADVENQARARRGAGRDYLRELERAGVLACERQESTAGAYAANRYTLVRDVGIETPRVRADGTLDTTPTDQERIWQALKAMTSFSVTDLQAATGIRTWATIRAYIGALHRAGYLAVVSAGGPGRQARYRLLHSRNTGPRPPAIRRGKVVYDLNLGRQMWPEVGA